MNVPASVHLSRIRTLLFLTATAALPLCAQPPKRYALVLGEEPVAQHFASREEMTSSQGRAWRGRIEAAQQALKGELANRQITVAGSATTLANAVFVVAPPERVAELQNLPGVVRVVPIRRRFHKKLNKATELVNAPAAWHALGGLSNAGRGIKIGIIDTGIDQTHPTFDPAGFSMPAGFPKCNPGTTAGKPDYSCGAFTTAKVIVARSYIRQAAAGSDPNNPAADSRPDDYTPRDMDGHGTAVASAAAGETATGVVTINGMAPGAWLGNYRVWGSDEVNGDNLPDDVIISALDDAFNDGMNVVSFSTGAPAFTTPTDTTGCGANQISEGLCNDLVAQAFENAAQNGLVVVVAAGNEGELATYPTFNTISSPANAKDVIAVGGSTNSHYFVTTVSVPADPSLQNIANQVGDAWQNAGAVTAPVVDVATLGNDGLLCSAIPASSLNGDIALVERGTCDFGTKVTNAQNAGAVGVIFYMADASAPIAPSVGNTLDYIPAVMISNADGVALKNFVHSHFGTPATIDPSGSERSDTVANEVVGFSSLGPSLGENLIKPDLIAVAGNEETTNFATLNSIYMATQSYDPYGEMYSSNRFLAADGTSFATPMVSGAAAMVKQAHPGYSVADVRSALINYASQAVKTDNTPASQGGPFTADVQWVGGGLLDAGAAVKATVTVSPATLSFGAVASPPPGPITLTVTNHGSSTVSLSAAPQSGATVNVTSGSSLSLPPGASGTVTVAIASNAPSTAGEYSGGITLQGSGVSLRVPYMYIIPNGANAKTPNIIPLTGDSFDATVGQQIPEGVLAFMVVDDFGIPVANQAVTWTVDSGSSGASLSAEDTVTNQYGIATAVATVGSKPGNYGFTANVQSLGVNHDFTGFARPAPTIRPNNGVENAASFGTGAIAPGSYIAIFGSGLSDGVTAQASTARLPVGLPGSAYIQQGYYATFVSFDVPSAGISVPGHLSYTSDGQVNVQVPWELQGQTSVQMKVGIDFTYGNVVTIPVSNYSPAFFTIGSNNVAALDLSYHVIGSTNPAPRGKIVQLFLNGLGPVTNQPANGDPAPSSPLSKTTTTPVVMIGGVQADVTCSNGCFSGLAPGYPGLYQINAVVPPNIGTGPQSITVAIGGQTSPAATLVVK